MGTKPDFMGWATRNDLLCSDGRTIRKNAFKDDDGQTVPLVWNHQHNEPTNILGHAVLENREDGVYAYGYFNDTDNGRYAKDLVQHGDITALSIYANKLTQRGHDVLHGVIREVSLVLAGANPGAYIDSCLAHGENSDEEAIIFTGEELYFAHADEEEDEEEVVPAKKKAKPESEETVADVFDTFTEKQKTVVYALIGQALSKGKGEETDDADSVAHADADDDGETVADVFNTLNEKQKTVAYALIGKALEEAEGSDDDDETDEDDEDNEGGNSTMKHNVFDANTDNEDVLSHSEVVSIFSEAKGNRSLKDTVLQHGITDIDYLFPDAQTVNNTPDFIKREDAWVTKVMNGVHHTPFSRVKSIHANLTEDAARAKGYIKGKQKVEEVFTLLKRSTTPTTVYKKQKLDRDDVIDITDFDVVAWIKGEMRMMLDEEFARAYLVGDGRNSSSDDKINEQNIRPIWTDADLYTIKVSVPVADNATDDDKAKAFIRQSIKARKDYKGSGNPTLFTTEDMLTDMLLIQDADGRDIYDSVEKLATKLRVKEIVTVPVMEGLTRKDESSVVHTLAGIIVNLADYNVGADKGGAVSMFDDFDIDFNAQKYLIEARCSGALVTPYSAMAIEFVPAT